MKKLVCFLLAVIMLVGMIPATTTADDMFPFVDVKDSHWAYQAVYYCYVLGHLKGMTDVTFGPNVTMTRAMFVQSLANMEGITADDLDAEQTCPFTDVKENHWFYVAVEWARQQGIVGGMTDTTFAPMASLTRAQMARLFHQYAVYKGLDTSATADLSTFDDGAKVPAWAEEGMKFCVGTELFVGSNNKLDSNGSATRAQLAVVLMKFDALNVPVEYHGRVVCWGDSLTAGILTGFEDVAEVPYPERVGEILGVDSFNYGIGSEISEQIACRQGAIPFYVNGFTIPADTTPVQIEVVLDEDGTPADIGFYGTAGVNPVEIGGIMGELNCDKFENYFTFTRLEAGDEEVVIEDMTPVITEGMRNVQDGDVIVLWIGSNNNYPAQGVQDLIAVQEAMIEHAGTDEFIILGFTAERYIPAWKELNAALEEYWGPTGKYIDVQEYLADPVRLEELGITPTGRDQEFMNQGWIPASLLADDELHLSQQGYDIVAQLVADRIIELGYLED